MRKLWSICVLVVLVGCQPVKDDRVPVTDAAGADAAGADAAVDAAVDAPATVIDYDIAYINELTFNNNIISISSFTVVVNRGPDPLKLAMTDIVVFTDDNATVNWTFTKLGSSTVMLPPGMSAGELSPLATQRILDTGLVTEPRVTPSNWNFGMQFSAVPANTTFNLNGQATIAIEDKRITLPFTIHFVPGANTAFNNASRIRVP